MDTKIIHLPHLSNMMPANYKELFRTTSLAVIAFTTNMSLRGDSSSVSMDRFSTACAHIAARKSMILSKTLLVRRHRCPTCNTDGVRPLRRVKIERNHRHGNPNDKRGSVKWAGWSTSAQARSENSWYYCPWGTLPYWLRHSSTSTLRLVTDGIGRQCTYCDQSPASSHFKSRFNLGIGKHCLRFINQRPAILQGLPSHQSNQPYTALQRSSRSLRKKVPPPS